MKDHSQNGEQRIILDYFGDSRGTVLDIGANDGVTFSNSRALIELGWSAVLVEPAEIAYGKLVQLYLEQMQDAPGAPEVEVVNAAITTQDGPIDFYDSGTHLKKGDTSLLSTTRPKELARWKGSGEQFTKTTVRGITFATLLKECGVFINRDPTMTATNQARFDMISIDAEGADYDILTQIDLTAVGCRMLCVEYNHEGQGRFTAYAEKHGMKLKWRCVENLIFTRG